MARRQRQSNGEAIVEGLGRLLPWWACLALAVASYLILHAIAARPAAVPAAGPGQLSGMVTTSIVTGLAMVGQYVLPLGFACAALVSIVVRRSRRKLVEGATGSDAAAAVASMSWSQFEELIGEGFRLQGYAVTERTKGGADGGIDLRLSRGTETFLVQAKHWKAYKVGVDVVRSLYGLMAAHGAAGGFVVTSGRFTADAIAFADGRNVQLVDGPKLLQLLEQARAGRGARTARPAVTPAPAQPLPASLTSAAAADAPLADGTPACPSCSRPMVLRTARRGANAGGSFWGCSGYSEGCRGTRPA